MMWLCVQTCPGSSADIEKITEMSCDFCSSALCVFCPVYLLSKPGPVSLSITVQLLKSERGV